MNQPKSYYIDLQNRLKSFAKKRAQNEYPLIPEGAVEWEAARAIEQLLDELSKMQK